MAKEQKIQPSAPAAPPPVANNGAALATTTPIPEKMEVAAFEDTVNAQLQDKGVLALLENTQAAAKKDDVWEREAADFWDPTKRLPGSIGEQLVGIYVGKEKPEGKRYTTHFFLTKHPKTGQPWPMRVNGSRILSKELAKGVETAGVSMPYNLPVRITFNGQGKTDSGQKLNEFTVQWMRK